MTYKHYLLFPEDRNRHEIIKGEHYMSPAPETEHQRIIGRLHRLLANHLEKNRVGEVLVSPVDVVLSESDVVQPDLVFLSKESLSKITASNIQGAPDLAIEVLSPSTEKRDLGLKKDLYARFGVMEYWVVHPGRRTVDVFRLGKSGYGKPKRYGRKASLPVGVIRGLVLDMKEVF